MTDEEIEKSAVAHAVTHSRDKRTHRWLQITRIGQIVGLLVLGVLVALLFIRQADRDKTALELVEQVQEGCDSGEFEGSICNKADDVEKDVKSDEVPVPTVVNVKGEDGAKGEEGKPGPRGKPGPKGDEGKPGRPGRDAVDGTNGHDGVDGTNGLSAYELAVGTGFQGTLEDWLASLKGQKGEPGESIEGPKGEDAWPFNFAFTFETRTGRVFTCPIQIGEDGSQTNAPSKCEPAEQTGNTGEDSNPSG